MILNLEHVGKLLMEITKILLHFFILSHTEIVPAIQQRWWQYRHISRVLFLQIPPRLSPSIKVKSKKCVWQHFRLCRLSTYWLGANVIGLKEIVFFVKLSHTQSNRNGEPVSHRVRIKQSVVKRSVAPLSCKQRDQ